MVQAIALEPKLLTHRSKLQEIYELRVAAWERSGKGEIVSRQHFPNGWRDEMDETALHWYISSEEGKIIAAARLNICPRSAITNHCPHIPNLALPHKDNMAILGRLVVHPDYQGQNLSTKLIAARLRYCDSHHVSWSHALVTSERIKKVLSGFNFESAGQIEVNYHEHTAPHPVNVFVRRKT